MRSSLYISTHTSQYMTASEYTLIHQILRDMKINRLRSKIYNIFHFFKLDFLIWRPHPNGTVKFKNGRYLSLLNLSRYDINELPGEISLFTFLEELKLYKNQITVFPHSYKTLINLKILNLSHNLIEKFPEAIREFKNLEILNLSHNKINIIPEWIAELTNLKELNISHNLLRELPSSLGKMSSGISPRDNPSQLKIFYFNDNTISKISENIGFITTLEGISSENNYPLPKEIQGYFGETTLSGNEHNVSEVTHFRSLILKKYLEDKFEEFRTKLIALRSKNNLTDQIPIVAEILELGKLYNIEVVFSESVDKWESYDSTLYIIEGEDEFTHTAHDMGAMYSYFNDNTVWFYDKKSNYMPWREIYLFYINNEPWK